MNKLRLAPRHGHFPTLIVRSAFTISVYHFCGNLGRKKQNRFIQSIFGREDRIGMFGVYSGEKTGSGCSECIREKRQDRGNLSRAGRSTESKQIHLKGVLRTFQ